MSQADSPGSDRILFITRQLTPYWREWLDRLALALCGKAAVHVFCAEEEGDDLHPWEGAAAPARVFYQKMPAAKGALLKTVWPSNRMWKAINDLSPKLVIIHEYAPYAVLSGMVWAKATGAACIVTTDVGPIMEAQLGPLQRLAHHLVNLCCDGILAKTQDAMDRAAFYRKPALLSPHAVDTEVFQPGGRRGRLPRRILQVGSLIPRKGPDLLIRAFARARRTRPDLELEIVGHGEQEPVLRLARELGVAEGVRIRPFVQHNELPGIYREADLFVLASRFDTWGVVVHEAAAAGLPLVISRHAGAGAVLVEHGENGFIVEPEDTEGFAEAILESLSEANYQKFGAHSRLVAVRYGAARLGEEAARWLQRFLPDNLPRTPGFRAGRAAGLLRWTKQALCASAELATDMIRPDPLGLGRRDIVFLNRYAPFYRDGIFRRIARWKKTVVVYSGRRLGNLRSACSVELEPCGCVFCRGKIVWLAAGLRLLRMRPSIVCTELSLSLFSTWLLFLIRPLAGFKLVFWTHGLQEYGIRGKGVGWKDRIRLLWLVWADGAVFYGRKRQEEVEKILGARSGFFLARNTIDTSEYETQFLRLGSSDREELRGRLGIKGLGLLFIGRIVPDKNPLALAALAQHLEQAGVVWSLFIIGEGPLEERLKKLLAPFGGSVRFFGAIFDPVKKCEWIYGSDAVVCPGYAGLNVAESLAMGTPFAGLDDGQWDGLRHSPEIEYVKDTKNGILAKNLGDLAFRLASRPRGKLVEWNREEIHSRFIKEASIEQQFEAFRHAFTHIAPSLKC